LPSSATEHPPRSALVTMGNKHVVMAQDIFRMLDEDGSKDLSWDELQMLSLCTPLAARMKEHLRLRPVDRIHLKWNREQLVTYLKEIGTTDDELKLIHQILKLKMLPNHIFMLLDKDGNGYVDANEFQGYLLSLKSEESWIAKKVDGTIAAILGFGDDKGRLDPPQFARVLILGGFDENQMQSLHSHVKETYGTLGLKAPAIQEHGVGRKDLKVDFCCDIRDLTGIWCSGRIIKTKRSRVKVTYDGWGSEYDEWVDIEKDFHRFGPMFKYSGQEKEEHLYRLDQAVIVYTPSPPPARWRYARVRKIHHNQICVAYRVSKQSYTYWFHHRSPEVKAVEGKVRETKERKERKTEVPENFPYFVGQIIEVLDTVARWEPAQILRVQGRAVFVHYVNWSSKYDEWLNIDKLGFRLRELGSANTDMAKEARMNKEQQLAFYKALGEKYGYNVVQIAGDGNCLFRSFAHQIYNDAEKHEEVRKQCCKYMLQERSAYEFFVDKDFSNYCKQMSKPKVWGGHVEIAALREMFNVNVEIFHRDGVLEPRPIGDATSTTLPMVRLAFEGKNHYNSIVDPKKLPPFGDGKDRKVSLKALRKKAEQKSSVRLQPVVGNVNVDSSNLRGPPTLRRQKSTEKIFAAREDPQSRLETKELVEVARKLTNKDSLIAIDKLRDLTELFMDELFKKKIKAYPNDTELLTKLKSDIKESSKFEAFVSKIPKTQETVGENTVHVNGVIKEFERTLLPDTTWRIQQALSIEKGTAKAGGSGKD